MRLLVCVDLVLVLVCDCWFVSLVLVRSLVVVCVCVLLLVCVRLCWFGAGACVRSLVVIWCCACVRFLVCVGYGLVLVRLLVVVWCWCLCLCAIVGCGLVIVCDCWFVLVWCLCLCAIVGLKHRKRQRKKVEQKRVAFRENTRLPVFHFFFVCPGAIRVSGEYLRRVCLFVVVAWNAVSLLVYAGWRNNNFPDSVIFMVS